MEKMGIWPGVILVITLAIVIVTIFPSDHKKCIDTNIKILKEMKQQNQNEELIKKKGREIGNECKKNYSFIISDI